MNKFLYINRDFNARMTGKRSRKNIFYIIRCRVYGISYL